MKDPNNPEVGNIHNPQYPDDPVEEPNFYETMCHYAVLYGMYESKWKPSERVAP